MEQRALDLAAWRRMERVTAARPCRSRCRGYSRLRLYPAPITLLAPHPCRGRRAPRRLRRRHQRRPSPLSPVPRPVPLRRRVRLDRSREEYEGGENRSWVRCFFLQAEYGCNRDVIWVTGVSITAQNRQSKRAIEIHPLFFRM